MENSLAKKSSLGEKAKDCIFCDRINAGTSILFETDNFYVKVGYGISAAGHIMIVSKNHYKCLAEVPKELVREYEVLCKKTEKAVNKEFGKTFSLDYGLGGQSIHHQHTHIIPLTGEDYEINDLIKEAVVPTGMKFERGSLDDLRRIYRSGQDYIWFKVDGKSYIYYIAGAYNPEKHLNWRYFISVIKGAKTVPLSWKDISEELKHTDNAKRELTKARLKPYFKAD